MMDNKLKIISLDSNKIWYEVVNNKKIVHKRTSLQEKNNLINAKKFLTNKTIKINDKSYSVCVPDIYAWNENKNILSMSYCDGKNLELLLRSSNTRKNATPVLQSMMRFILSHHFYWQDFAPRNIILNDKTIYLVDFEKGLSFSIDDLKTFFRNHVFEEYSSFLLPNECLISAEQIFSPSPKEIDKRLNVNDIQVKRIKYIANALGYEDTITMNEYLNIQKMILKAEEPFYSESNLVFPRVHLSEMLENKTIIPSVYQNYAREILLRNNISPTQLTAKEIERD